MCFSFLKISIKVKLKPLQLIFLTKEERVYASVFILKLLQFFVNSFSNVCKNVWP